jgi:hypothetical protein
VPPVEDVKLSTAQLSALRKQVIEHRDEALSERGDWPERHAERYRRFMADPSLRPEGPWPGSPKLFVPVTRSVHEKLQSEIWATLFGSDDFLRLDPFGEEDVDNAELATRFLRWSLNSLVDQGWWASESMAAIFDCLMDSAAVCKVVAWTPPWTMPNEARQYFRRIVRIDTVDLSTMLVPPDATGFQYPKARYLGQEFFQRKDDLRRFKRMGYDTPDLDNFKGEDVQPTERQKAEGEREGQTIPFAHKDVYRFVEQYERFVLDSRTRLEEDVIVSYYPDAEAGDGTHSAMGRIARVRRMLDVFPQDDRPRRPYFDITVWPQPRQWKGMNVPDRLEVMQDLTNRLHEQLINYGEVSILPYVFANTFLTGDLPDLRQVRPGSTVPIDDNNGVQFVPTRSLNRHFAEQISMALANIERDSSVTDFNQGRQPDRPNVPRTASATMALLQESRKAFGAMARHAAIQFQRLLSFYFRTWQAVLPETFVAPVLSAQRVENPERRDALARLFGGDLTGRYVARRVNLTELSGLYDAKLEISPEATFDRQVLVALAQMILPELQDYPAGKRELLMRIWKAHNQTGFDAIWPEQIANVNTQIALMAKDLQLSALKAQLGAQAQAQEQAQQQAAQQQAMQQSTQQATANGAGETPMAQRVLETLQAGVQQEAAGGEGQQS